MKKRDYDYLEECFDKLLHDYNCAQAEIKDLKETVEILRAICHANGIEVHLKVNVKKFHSSNYPQGNTYIVFPLS